MKLKFLTLFMVLSMFALGTQVSAQDNARPREGVALSADEAREPGAPEALPSPATILKALCSFLAGPIKSQLPASCQDAFNEACNSVNWAPLNCCMQYLKKSNTLGKVSPILGTLCTAACNGGGFTGVCKVKGVWTTLCQPAVDGKLPLPSLLCGYVCSGIDASITNCRKNCMKDTTTVFQQTNCPSGDEKMEFDRAESSRF